MPSFIDSHAHLADPAFDADRAAVIERARGAGTRASGCGGESLAAARRAQQIAVDNPGFVFSTAGVHPHDAAQFDRNGDIEAIKDLIHRGTLAIGECGLDSHYDHSPRDQQRRAFAEQLA